MEMFSARNNIIRRRNILYGKLEFSDSTPHIVVITSGKGDVGKTTTTANIDLSITSFGFSVVAIDDNIDLRNLDLLLGLENYVNYIMIKVLNGDQGVVSDNSMSVKGGWQDLLQWRSMIDFRFCKWRRGSTRGSFETHVTYSGAA
ncbi:putative septum site-determining protein minD, chloroplastic [Glycine soja]